MRGKKKKKVNFITSRSIATLSRRKMSSAGNLENFDNVL